MRPLALAAAALAVIATAAPAQAAVIVFTNRADFNAASSTSTITFEGLAPANFFTFFNSPPGLTTSGVNFQATPGTNLLFVIDPGFAPPQFNFPSGQFLQNNAFVNGAGIDAFLPAGVTAVGADVSAQFPPGTGFTATVTLSSGEVFNFPLQSRPTLSFVGFASDTPISSVRFTTGGGANGTTIDNFSFGVSTIPEPATFAVFGALAAGAFGLRRRMKAAPAA